MKLNILGVPFSYGQPHTGVKDAAETLRHHGLFRRLRKIALPIDLGDLDLSFVSPPPAAGSLIKNEPASSWANQKISETIEQLSLKNNFLLNIGGDHGLALGTIHGILSHRPNTVVVWADAHGDINTPETSHSGNFHGMPLAFLLGLNQTAPLFSWIKNKLSANKLIFFGPRDLDSAEKRIIDELGIQYYSSEDINRWGAKDLLEKALYKADPFSESPIHLSFDVDIFDPNDVSATGTRVPKGPRLEEVFLMGGLLGQTGRLRSMDVVELNPHLGNKSEIQDTTDLTLDFIESTISEVYQSAKVADLSVAG